MSAGSKRRAPAATATSRGIALSAAERAAGDGGAGVAQSRWAILNAAGLSFIGLGVKPPTPEWASWSPMRPLHFDRQVVAVAFPGLALMLSVLCFNLLGDGMRDILDPRMRT